MTAAFVDLLDGYWQYVQQRCLAIEPEQITAVMAAAATTHWDEPETAIESISAWQAVLKGSKDEGSKEISNSLKELKHLLGLKKADPAKIAEVLAQLGDQTDTAADQAERGTKGQLRDLGKALHKIAKTIGS